MLLVGVQVYAQSLVFSLYIGHGHLVHDGLGGGAHLGLRLRHHGPNLLPGEGAGLDQGPQLGAVHALLGKVGQHDHGHAQHRVQLGQHVLVPGVENIDPVLIQRVAGAEQVLLLVGEEQGQFLQRIGTQLIRSDALDAALLDANVHDIGGILGQGQVTVRLHHQQGHDDQDEADVFFQILENVQHWVRSFVALPG